AAQTRSFSYVVSRGWLASETHPENGLTQYAYTTEGLLYTKTDAKGTVTRYRYDSLHRVLGVRYDPNAFDDVSFTYDNPTEIGRLKQVDKWNATGSFVTDRHIYGYDGMGRMTSESLVHWDASGPSTFVLSALYQYNNKLGNLTQITYPNPQTGGARRTLNLTYNALGRLTTIHNFYNGTTGVAPDFDVVSGVSYNVGGTVDSFTYGNGLVENRTYDANRVQLTNLKVTNPSPASTIMDFSYLYTDANGKNNGQLQQATDNVDTTRTQQYSYDSLVRLSQFKLGPIGSPSTTMNFTYDPYGNRTAQATIGPGPTMNLTYDSATNRITTTGYGYDLNGNLTNAPSSTVYAYDLGNRLTSVTVGATVQGSYTYNGMGLRISKTVGTTQTFYFHTQVGLLGEYQRPAGTTQVPSITKEYVYRGRQALATIASGAWTYNHMDRLGSTRKLTDGNRNVIITRDYYPFGEESASTSNNEKKFTGYYRDQESNLDYALNRYYRSDLGRFMATDPFNIGSIQLPCGSKGSGFPAMSVPDLLSNSAQIFNLYAYVTNDSVNKIDPFGYMPNFCDAQYSYEDCFGVTPWGNIGESRSSTRERLLFNFYLNYGIRPRRPSQIRRLLEFINCFRRLYQEANTKPEWNVPDHARDKMQHCWVGCELINTCGAGWGTVGLAAIGKEVLDLFLPGHTSEVADAIATTVGIPCSLDPAGCVACCERHGY
ncbi:MAG: hypothetical protein HY232_17080, partial [Acidobacteria bacterium]|nr:hypothetical protein [Acidobacteriota bacterium]